MPRCPTTCKSAHSDWNLASFAGSLAIVRNGKPFTDGEYAKTFMLDIMKQIKDIPLSTKTVHDRTIRQMTNQVEETQMKDINAAPYFSLSLDESTDVSHLSQFIMIARYAAGDTLPKKNNIPMDNRILYGTWQKHNQFKTLLNAVGNNYPGLHLHNVDVKDVKFYYLVDMTEHLNQLNVKIRSLHFEKRSQFASGFTSNLLQSFKALFGESCEHTRLFKFITHPLECAVDKADLRYMPGVSIRDFELELADLKASDMWVNKFKSLNEDLEGLAQQQAELANQLTVNIWNTLPVKYHTLQRVSIAVLTMFGSMYTYEQMFSHLKNIKTNKGSRLTDGSLNACMKLNLTMYQPDYKAISKTMQHQKSH
uniref:HAT C-terminal dimerisation domain-containing protein n=1 Tax=Amphiprion percula TaxID=161767 RepID=A0A3P8TT79_AMPPE